MSLCRICLCEKARRNLTELEINEAGTNVDYVEIISFCLDLKVNSNTTFTKLCVKCYRRLIEYYKFKKLARQSDEHLKTILVSKEVFVSDDIKKEELFDIDYQHEDSLSEPAIPIQVKQEPAVEGSPSDDEILSVIKKIKYELIEVDNVKENDPIQNIKTKSDCTTEQDCKPLIDKVNKKIKHPTSLQVCEECGKEVKDIRSHAKTHRPKSSQLRQCELCDKVLSSKTALNKHVKRKHLGVKKECSVCKKKVSNLRQHVSLMHERDSLPLCCAACGRRFPSASTLRAHAAVHTAHRPHHCALCPSKFRLKILLDNHVRRVHEKLRPHLCQFCSKSFFKKDHLLIHLRSHTMERPYACGACGRRFASRSLLNNHATTHSEERAHACHLCHMTFARKGYLSAHMKSHLKLKRYPCQYCGVRFHRSDHRARHEHTAHLKHAPPPHT